MARLTLKKQTRRSIDYFSTIKALSLILVGWLSSRIYDSLVLGDVSDYSLLASGGGHVSSVITTPDDEQQRAIIHKESNPSANTGWSQIDVFYGSHEQLVVDRYTGLKADIDEKWQSQMNQDHVVYQVLNELQGGYFIDLAANDATVISNSYALETHHNWNGLCLEANPKYWARLAYRKCKTIGAVVGHNRMEEIDFNFGMKGSELVRFGGKNGLEFGMGGGIDKKDFSKRQSREGVIAKRHTVTLGEIFDRNNVPPVIDYLSLDVERAESYVMMGFPYESYTFKVMTVEQPKEDLKELLKTKGYIHKGNLEGPDELWVHGSFEKSCNWKWAANSTIFTLMA